MSAARALRGAFCALLLAAPAFAQFEPPPEAPEGADYVLDQADSLEQGAVEVALGLAGAKGESSRRSRRVRFAEGDFAGDVRDGDGDPLTGGGLDGRIAGGRLGFGRLAPRWGRGLVIGAPGDPWSAAALDRGAGAPFRGRAGDGVWWRAGSRTSLELLGGRFAKRELAGAALAHGPWSLGVLGDRGRRRQWSLGFGAGAGEIAIARDGAWRAETRLERALHDRSSLVVLARAGHAAFRPLAEPRRAGPSRALAAHGTWRGAVLEARAQAAAWRFAPGVAGARAALEVERTIAHHDALVVGIEEQQGTRREPPARSPGFRHGAWGEWRATRGALAVTLRHELHGARRLARERVRASTAVRIEADGPAGARVRLTHWAWSTRRGETLYLPEAASDRLVLRALSGVGERTRLELRLPWSGGRLNASVALDDAGGTKPPRWTLDWSRRARGRPP